MACFPQLASKGLDAYKVGDCIYGVAVDCRVHVGVFALGLGSYFGQWPPDDVHQNYGRQKYDTRVGVNCEHGGGNGHGHRLGNPSDGFDFPIDGAGGDGAGARAVDRFRGALGKLGNRPLAL